MQLCGKCTKFYEGENCPFCGVEQETAAPPEPVVEDANAKENKEKAEEKKNSRIGCFTLIIILLVVGFVVTRCAGGGGEPAISDDGNESEVVELDDAVYADTEESVEDEPEEVEPEPEPVLEMSYELISTRTVLYYNILDELTWVVMVEIENTGDVPIDLGRGNYDLRDDAGYVLGTGSMSTFPSVLNPGEKGAFWDRIVLGDVDPATNMNFEPRWDISESRHERTGVDLSNIEVRDGQFGVTVFGNVTNNTDDEQSWIIVSALIYGHDGSLLGVFMTNLMGEDIPVGTTVGFEVGNLYNRTLFEDFAELTLDMVGDVVVFANTPSF